MYASVDEAVIVVGATGGEAATAGVARLQAFYFGDALAVGLSVDVDVGVFEIGDADGF